MEAPTAVSNSMSWLLSTSGRAFGQIIIGDYFPAVVSHPWALLVLLGGRP